MKKVPNLTVQYLSIRQQIRNTLTLSQLSIHSCSYFCLSLHFSFFILLCLPSPANLPSIPKRLRHRHLDRERATEDLVYLFSAYVVHVIE